jgi:hypothetical protein
MTQYPSSPSIREIDFQLSRRTERPELPVSPWTDLVFDGERVFVRSRRRLSLPAPSEEPGAGEWASDR